MKKWAIVAPVEKKDFEKKEEEKNFVKDELEKERKKKLRLKRIWKDQEPVIFSFD